MLERAGVDGPYVLVGHSSADPYVRVFAARYPDEVAGMVLLDAQPADAFTAEPDYPAFYGPYRSVMTVAPSLARIGLGFPFFIARRSLWHPRGSRRERRGHRTA